MGTFEGHISPGVAFYTFGLLWMFQYSYRYQAEQFLKQSSAQRPKGRCRRCMSSVPWESVMKIVYGTMAALAEFFYPLGVNKLEMFRDGELQHPNEWQHFTMYSYFAISGIVDIISLKILEHRSKTLEKLFVALAFGVESFLLYNHRHGKGSLENNIHILIFITAFACCVVSAAEIWHPTQWLLPFMRTGLVSLQGTFFFHAAFIIYRPVSGIPWDSNDHRATMFVTMAYSWHILLNIIIMSCIYGTVYLFCGRRWRKRSQYYVNESPSKSNGIRQEEIEMIADTSDDEQYSSLRPLKN